MKKILLLLPFVFLFSNCEIKIQPQQVKAETHYDGWNDYYNAGMHYVIKYHIIGAELGNCGLRTDAISSATLINITKDSLECEYYKQHIKYKNHD